MIPLFNVGIDTKVEVKSTVDGRLRGFVTPPGVAVYANTREELLHLAEQAVDVMMKSFLAEADPLGVMKGYFEARGADFSLEPVGHTALKEAGATAPVEIVESQSPAEINVLKEYALR